MKENEYQTSSIFLEKSNNVYKKIIMNKFTKTNRIRFFIGTHFKAKTYRLEKLNLKTTILKLKKR